MATIKVLIGSVIVCGCVLAMWSGKKDDHSDAMTSLDNLQLGMTISEVEAILGRPADVTTEFTWNCVKGWRVKEGWIQITFSEQPTLTPAGAWTFGERRATEVALYRDVGPVERLRERQIGPIEQKEKGDAR